MTENVLATLQDLSKSERRERLQQYIVDELRQALSMGPVDMLPLDANLFDLGLTSLGLETLKQQFEKTFDHPLNSAEMFNHPTAAHFIRYFEQALMLSEVAPERPAADEWTEEHVLANAALENLYRTIFIVS